MLSRKNVSVAAVVLAALLAVSWMALDTKRADVAQAADARTADGSKLDAHAQDDRAAANLSRKANQTSSTPDSLTSGRATATAAYVSAPLPPPDAPIKDVMTLLRADADRGVPQAACRVGIELTRCMKTAEYIKAMVPKFTNTKDDPDHASLYADRDRCDGVDEQDIDNAWRYLRQAAQSGSVAAMAKFATDPPLSATNFTSQLEGWAAFNELSDQYLLQALNSGDVRALQWAYFIAASGIRPGSIRSKDRNPYQALVYGRALAPLVVADDMSAINRYIAKVEAQLGPEQSAQAARDADRLRIASFSRVTDPVQISNNAGFVDPAQCGR